MNTSRAFGLLAVLLIGVAPVEAQKKPQPPPIPVFVTSVGAKDGFTDPNKDNRDTVKDLRNAMKRFPELGVVDKIEDARIVLTVQQRETAAMTMGFVGMHRDRVLHVAFKYKDVETDMRASAAGGSMTSGGAWTAAAGKLAKQVREWVKLNRDKLDKDKADLDPKKL